MPSGASGPRLLIAVPALDEEASIEETIRRCLAARDDIVTTSPVVAVEIAVVSDDFTDRTVEIACRYTDQVQLVNFPHNRGYSAAIQEAWRRSDCELLGFLDADGNCVPRCFPELRSTLVARDAAIALGSDLVAERVAYLAAPERLPPLRPDDGTLRARGA